MNSTAMFDHMAGSYDSLWTETPIGRAQRNLVWRQVDELFPEGQKILDIGCGTGKDAAHFAARGVKVHATDASPAMVVAARTRGISAEVCRAEELSSIGGTFDGAISNFGALNCVRDLTGVAASLAKLVRPGGRVAICLLSRCCAWETVYYGVRLKFAKASRRWGGRAQAGDRLMVYYPTTDGVMAAFAEGFRLESWAGIGLLVPPSYVKLPARLVGFLGACDQWLTRVPLLRAVADHRLFVLVRK